MVEYICAVRFSRMRFRIAGVPIMISWAATRPPPLFLSSVCETTAWSDSESIAPDHVLLGGRKHVDDAVDGLRGGARVQGSEHEVAGLGRGQGEPNRLEVAHLAHQDDIGVLAKRGAQRLAEAERVPMDFTLADEALPAPVDELDRVFDGEDVPALGCVLVVDHRGKRGRLAGAGRPGDQHHAPRGVGDILENLRGAQLFQ